MGDWLLLVQAAGGWAPLVWAGDGGLKGMWCLLCDIQVAGTELCGLSPLGACEWAPSAAPVNTGVGKKKECTATRTTCIALTSLGNTPALQLPQPNFLGGTQTLDPHN